MARPNSLQSRIEKRIAESREYVFLTREFTDLSGRRQVLRALRKIVSEGRLVRLGCGVYGLAFTSGPSDRPILFHPHGFIGAARTALTKLGVAKISFACRFSPIRDRGRNIGAADSFPLWVQQRRHVMGMSAVNSDAIRAKKVIGTSVKDATG